MARTSLTVYCLCAAWCRTCVAYAEIFQSCAIAGVNRAEWVWVDIEDEAEVVGEIEVENFPCLLLVDERHVYFFGPVRPQATVLERLFEKCASGQAAPVLNREVDALSQRLLGLKNRTFIRNSN